MKTKDMIKILKTKNQEQEVEFLVVDKRTTGIVAMELTSETADLGKLFKAFKAPKKDARNEVAS